ncbi:MAG: HicB family protein [Candidatus Omnitrophica bacterium CG12_big_fil_rev_8_21_14_0_65_43_15]|uniref:HicB family protein n=1 Tax=Candidatus Taenaricola geysiri TaxID=1974752 RepID=A0A2J0LQ81_9BACT|nr:MAG: HicB family protein [Candidatus Omnitrophica bacterium CG1_02_43_210]PIV11575.1 MAG: HicB family protein [Candidatus Omnitrophica bacterium CG03_land_8_20_14_0_80_43_22]PIW66916.1 MAG: HicB family protein [Candidatus Omnitrophica bacterium CG12_big_fil_rev_8_21_14_0_65_43_15]PIW80615.1 MAG: HicB family protein [Candidatus Omnitrophica bacterium CG_4_8_14_3_um_filter_43_15]PIY84209.1 MAG: HicB family protein [Candidatus Omnitrophica bacterium CG_4_10_14_0_8_um_filter_43_18]PJC45729.1 MA
MLRRFKIILEPESEGGFSVFVPALPGCATQGGTLEECLKNAKEAVELYIQSLIEDKISLPESDVLMEEIEVTV